MSYFKTKMHEFDFGWGSSPDPAGEAYSAPPVPLAGFKGAYSKGRETRKAGVEGQGRRERVEKGRGKEKRTMPALFCSTSSRRYNKQDICIAADCDDCITR